MSCVDCAHSATRGRANIDHCHARDLIQQLYYLQYGLAIRGLIQHHRVDPVDYDRECDSALPLDFLKPNPMLQQLIADINRQKYRVWCLTNAQANVRLLSPTASPIVADSCIPHVIACRSGTRSRGIDRFIRWNRFVQLLRTKFLLQTGEIFLRRSDHSRRSE